MAHWPTRGSVIHQTCQRTLCCLGPVSVSRPVMVAAIGFWFPKQPADTEGNVSSHSATKVFPADDQLTLEWDGTYRGGGRCAPTPGRGLQRCGAGGGWALHAWMNGRDRDLSIQLVTT